MRSQPVCRFLLVLLVAVSSVTAALGQVGVRAAFIAQEQRADAPEFHLLDSSGKTADLKSYRGKIVLLDFWATWCHGCKEEIPWFAEFNRKYAYRGVQVVGVSLDDGGWKVVKPFIENARIPYRILLGDETVSSKYRIAQMPDTFLIDRRGRIAAKYVGLVDRADVDAKIQAVLAEQSRISTEKHESPGSHPGLRLKWTSPATSSSAQLLSFFRFSGLALGF